MIWQVNPASEQVRCAASESIIVRGKVIMTFMSCGKAKRASRKESNQLYVYN
jgi:hypothetical protein